ncbi:uncharacterized protein [Nicotiana tomentosiformis]|uniref:uncharacterized protein n=1 Tax=Nicotiana tomentosiformis TaxID=4098 RepID=UPI00388C9045
MAEELKKLTGRVQSVEGGKGIEGLNYEDLCIQLDVELPEGYKPPKFEMFDGTSDPKVHLRTYCDKLVGVGKDERIRIKILMRSLTGDALSSYISQNPKKWVNWMSMASNFIDQFRFNTENAQDIFYIQNLKKKPTETFCELNTENAQDIFYFHNIKKKPTETFRKYATRWRSEAAKAKEVASNIRNNPLPDHRGEGVNVIETDEEWDSEGSIGLIREGDNLETSPVTLTPIARRKGKAKMEETSAAQGMTRTGRVYTPEHLGGTSKEAVSKPPVIETGPDDLWRKVQPREYSVVDYLNKTPAQMSILSLLQNFEAHRNALMKVLNKAYVPNNITSGGQVLESHKITFHEDELPPEGLSHNKALHITVQFEDKFIARVLIDGGSSLNICPLTTLKRLGKGLHGIRAGNMNVKAFNGYQKAKIGETNLGLQMGPTWFDVEFQGVIIQRDRSNPIYINQTVPVVENRRKLGGETYHCVKRVNTIEKDKWQSSKIEGILAWTGYEPGKGIDMNCSAIVEEEAGEDLIIQKMEERVILKNWTAAPSRAR